MTGLALIVKNWIPRTNATAGWMTGIAVGLTDATYTDATTGIGYLLCSTLNLMTKSDALRSLLEDEKDPFVVDVLMAPSYEEGVAWYAQLKDAGLLQASIERMLVVPDRVPADLDAGPVAGGPSAP